jgi:Bacterial regulatory proteins, tetR family
MPKKIDHEERREELVRAVWRVIVDRGVDEATMREIARESGYSVIEFALKLLGVRSPEQANRHD